MNSDHQANTCVTGISEGEEIEKGSEGIQGIMTNICQVGDRHQITEPRNQRTPTKIRYQENSGMPAHILKLLKTRDRKPSRQTARKAMLSTQKQKQNFVQISHRQLCKQTQKRNQPSPTNLGNPLKGKMLLPSRQGGR